jgi:hypothetical protein
MSRRSYRPALQKFSGKGDDWPAWCIDFQCFLVKGKFEKHRKKTNPSLLPRVTASYTIATSDDPHGPIP